MSAYISGLRASVERTEAKRAEKDRIVAEETARERLVPLEERLQRLLATIPAEMQAEGLSLMSLQSQLRARGRGHSRCHVGELGEAMRKLGYERLRRWKNSSAYQALWYPNKSS